MTTYQRVRRYPDRPADESLPRVARRCQRQGKSSVGVTRNAKLAAALGVIMPVNGLRARSINKGFALGVQLPALGARVATELPTEGSLSANAVPIGWLKGMAHVQRGLAAESHQDPRLRGQAEVRLYARTSPSVVLVVTPSGYGTGSIVKEPGTILTVARQQHSDSERV